VAAARASGFFWLKGGMKNQEKAPASARVGGRGAVKWEIGVGDPKNIGRWMWLRRKNE